jgi:hypothetical protein
MNYRFHNVGKARARIVELSKSLGIDPGEPIFKINLANQRVLELEQMLAAKAPVKPQQTNPAPVAAPAPILAPPAVKLTGLAAVRAGAKTAYDADKSRNAIPVNHSRQAPAVVSREQAACEVSREKLEVILKIAQPTANSMPASWPIEACRIEVERACFQAHLNFPQFMAGEAELMGEYHRSVKPNGVRLYIAAEAKRKIESILNSK